MSTEANKQIVLAFNDAMTAGNSGAVLDFLAPGAIWWLLADTPGGTAMTKEDIAPTLKVFDAIYRDLPRINVVSLTAEDDRVAMEKTARGGLTHGGVPYDNDYFMLFRLRDGLIVEIREYLNPKMAAPLMAEVPDGGN